MKREELCSRLYRGFKRVASFALAACMTVTLCACGSTFEGYVDEDVDYQDADASGKNGESKRIGVSLPTKDLQRWVQDGQNIETSLRDSGYMVDLQYAENKADLQNEQVSGMIEEGCDVLLISAVDGYGLADTLAAAKEKGIIVIAYDRLIMNTDAVSYYASFDNAKVGQLQGQYIVDALDLEHTQGPYNLEIFTGSPDDNNCKFYFGEAMKVLKPYVDAGKLVIPSGQATQEACSIKSWSTDVAKERMDSILSKYYGGGKKIDAVLSSNDSVAMGIIQSLSDHYKGDFPVLTGQDCDINAMKQILNGRQSMSIYKDTRELAKKVVEMINAVLEGKEVPVNDTTSYDNGKGAVPSYLCEPVFADKSNYKEILIDSGYYTADQLK